MLPENETQGTRAGAIGRVAATAVLVGVAYYVGAKVGLVLRFPPAMSSVVWPPNSILTATLLLSPRRRWWLYLLAAFPAHLAGELPADWPIPLVLVLFATNCSEALLAAVCVRWFTEVPARLDTLRRMVAFIAGAALVAPFLSSFLDAAAVDVLHGEPYWLVWRTRFFSNVLTELTVVPAILTVASAAPGWLRRASPRRRVEAGLLAASLLAVAFVSFGAKDGPPAVHLSSSQSPLAFLLPFLLWASVRFGPPGASLSLLTTALIAIWAGTQGRGPFTRLPAAESVFALQIFLTVVAIPLMCLAALIEERRRGEEALGERLRFEQFLARLSAAFVHLPSHDIDAAIASWLRSLGEFLRHDRLVVLRLSAGGRGLAVSHSWVAPGIELVPPIILARDLPWALERLLREEPLIFSSRQGFSHSGAPDEAALRHAGLCSSLTIPLVASGSVLGGLAFDSLVVERAWPEEKVQRLQLVGEVFANALARKETEDALRATRQELAHFTRVSAMGELTASLAHELRQPLTGIMTNAQAARRFLEIAPLDIGELRNILGDIIADDRRAADVIQRLRDLLRKGERRLTLLDLNDLIRGVSRLLSSDAVIRNVVVALELAPEPVIVTGDRVQLEQVVLNLLVNAMDSVAEAPGGDRTIVVRTESKENAAVHVAVQDAGTGLRDGTHERVFEPFFTTKPAGMGMGLSVSKSIIEAHGGVIWATNNPARGATFHFSLPEPARRA
jgi:signal transduction histidine kinase/integral membrane sensor domain MASE1